MTNDKLACILADTAIDFLAQKHGVSRAVIVDGLNSRHPKLLDQFATLVVEGIMQIH